VHYNASKPEIFGTTLGFLRVTICR